MKKPCSFQWAGDNPEIMSGELSAGLSETICPRQGAADTFPAAFRKREMADAPYAPFIAPKLRGLHWAPSGPIPHRPYEAGRARRRRIGARRPFLKTRRLLSHYIWVSPCGGLLAGRRLAALHYVKEMNCAQLPKTRDWAAKSLDFVAPDALGRMPSDDTAVHADNRASATTAEAEPPPPYPPLQRQQPVTLKLSDHIEAPQTVDFDGGFRKARATPGEDRTRDATASHANL